MKTLFLILFLNARKLTVGVDSRFNSLNLYQEFLEFVGSDQNNLYYFDYLDKTVSYSTKANSTQELYNKLLQTLVKESFISKERVDLLELMFSLRVYSPAVEAKANYFNDYIQPNLSPEHKECTNIIVFGDKVSCSLKDISLQNEKNNNLFNQSNPLKEPVYKDIDRIYLNKIITENSRIATVYTCLTENNEFIEIHDKLKQISKQEEDFVYILRYKRCMKESNTKLYLSGYGAVLNIKDMEYYNIDDREYTDDKEQVQLSEESEESEIEKIIETTDKILSFNNHKDFGAKVAQYILKAKNNLKTLNYITSNLPQLKHHISTLKVNRKKCMKFDDEDDGGGFMFFGASTPKETLIVNGIKIDMESVNDIYAMVNILDAYKKGILQIKQALNITNKQALNLLTKDYEINKIKKMKLFDVRDAYPVIMYLNNIEKDSRYKKWKKSLSTLFEPTYTGQLPKIRRNYLTVVLCLDLSKHQNLNLVTKDISMFVENKIPIRFGIVPIFNQNNKISINFAELIYNMYDNLKLKQFMQLLRQALSKYDQTSEDSSQLYRILRELYQPHNMQNELINHVEKYINRLSIVDDTMFVNGMRIELTKNFNEKISYGIRTQLEYLKNILAPDLLENEDLDFADYLMEMPHVMKQYDASLYQNNQYVSYNIHSLKMIVEDYHYLTNNVTDSPKTTTTILIADLNDQSVWDILVGDLLEYLTNDNQQASSTRVLIIHNGKVGPEHIKSNVIFQILYKGITTMDVALINKFYKMYRDMSFSTIVELYSLAKEYKINISPSDDEFDEEKRTWAKLVRQMRSIGIDTDSQIILVNGKIYTINNCETFDLKSILRLESIDRIDKIAQQTSYLSMDSDQTMQITAAISKTQHDINTSYRKSIMPSDDIYDQPVGNDKIPNFTDKKARSCYYEKPSSEDEWANIQFVLDPISENTQRVAAILEKLSEFEGIGIRGYFSPVSDENKVTLNRFYRYNINKRIGFVKGEIKPPVTVFNKLPKDESIVYELALDTIPQWVTSPFKSVSDLDNIIFKNEENSLIEALYELNSIMIDGHSFDKSASSPSKGLQLRLDSVVHNSTMNIDTIVMQNLGYFQFSSRLCKPNIYHFIIRPNSRSHDLYDISQVKINNQIEETAQKAVVLSTRLSGVKINMFVKKKLSMENEQLLVDDLTIEENKASLWDSIKTKISGKAKNNETINVFTVASGHLYERLASVMILSVLNNTESKVKFWFIEMFLSPSFKKFMPNFAKEYDFEYEFVSYQWPHWLNQQNTKQRKIWGYKILFLDVLFPLHLKKIIFVDSDQIVRHDLNELLEIDLKNKPYGYVKFCDSREDMDNYRFWEQGYWKDYLGGKPYHISALYVVDLVRFRELAAGDMLRGHYQMLSQDPNSLANLDQDLPNHLQHQLPIHTLPQEWLWCETWCDDKSLEKAKTIDLCNNPKTKESKLKRAKRIAKEWEIYDNKIAPLRDSIFESVSQPPSKQESATEEEKDEL